jgi:hypothetical protein
MIKMFMRSPPWFGRYPSARGHSGRHPVISWKTSDVGDEVAPLDRATAWREGLHVQHRHRIAGPHFGTFCDHPHGFGDGVPLAAADDEIWPAFNTSRMFSAAAMNAMGHILHICT